ncbi:MAG TPA: Wzz/FepE/Etk N-terminal domain-containing protein [Burkholderiaceae bacterium]|nr:Wzz/FepE/Etk N-terminal domain-containing protein [Burkholderiaceae bacterium]
MSFVQFLSIVRARLGQILLVFLVVVGLALAVSAMMTKKYSASAQVLIDVQSPDRIGGTPIHAQLLPSHMATQIELIKSPKVALRVVERLKLAEGADPRVVAEAGGHEALRQAYADRLLKNLTVKPSRDSNVLTLIYTDTERTLVAPIVNGFVQAYVDATVDIRVGPARETREFLVEQAKQLRENLEQTQARLANYTRTRGIISTDDRTDVEMTRLQELSTQLTTVQGQLIEASKRADVARRGGADAPEVLQSPLVQQLMTDRNRAATRLREQGAVLGPNHPEMIKLRQEYESIQQRLQQEIGTVVSSLGRAHQALVQREAELRAAVERQRARILSVRQNREELSVLQRDFENAQKAYDDITHKLNQTALESQVQQANVVPMTSAIDPLDPSSPNLRLNLMLGAIMGALLAVTLALLLELFRGRVRIPQDLERVTERPILGSLTRVPRRLLRQSTELRLGYVPSRPHAGAGAAATAAAGAAAADAASSEPRETEPVMAEEVADGAERGARGRAAGAGPSARMGGHGAGPSAGGGNGAGYVAGGAAGGGMRAAGGDGEGARAAGGDGEAAGGGNFGLPTAFEWRAPATIEPHPMADADAGVSSEVIAAHRVDHPFLDDLRVIRGQIKARWLDGSAQRKAVAVVSQGRGEGKSFTAANLAVSFAQIGIRTLLIDGDMHTGRLHRMFGLRNTHGLSTLLALSSNPRDALYMVPGLVDLAVIPCGPQVPSPTDLLARDTLPYLLEMFSRVFDIVIVDTPSATNKPDASLIVGATRGYMVVALEDQTLLGEIDAMIDRFGALGGTMIGSVLVRR